MAQSSIAQFDVLRSLAAGSISSSYAAIGTPFQHQVRIVCFTNNTDGDLFLSVDGVNNNLFLAKGSFKLFDLTTNKDISELFVSAANTQFFVKQSTAPTTGSVYIECIYGKGQ